MTNKEYTKRRDEILTQLQKDRYTKSDMFADGATNTAKQAIDQLVLDVIGEDEQSGIVKEFRCPNYSECFGRADYWKMNQKTYCSSDGRLMKLYKGKEEAGDDWTNNELRQAQRKIVNDKTD